MRNLLPHVIHRAATCPEFRRQLFTNPEAVIGEHTLDHEDVMVLKDVLEHLMHEPTRELIGTQDQATKGGWDSGPSFTAAAIS